jgi:hypothetical protein
VYIYIYTFVPLPRISLAIRPTHGTARRHVVDSPHTPTANQLAVFGKHCNKSRLLNGVGGERKADDVPS